MALVATPVFSAAQSGAMLTFFESWSGALAYSLQLYFDFSGYSDMAIGIARIFGIHIPINFNSPYKASSIIDFWKRWHVTLSRFLRDYLYIPLGGNRKGKGRRYVNLMTTMILGGLWHGAGWTFVLWGALHGVALVINHLWRAILGFCSFKNKILSYWSRGLSRLVTFIVVVFGWVFFRAETLDGAIKMCRSMLGINGIVFSTWYLNFATGISWLDTSFLQQTLDFGKLNYVFSPMEAITLLIVVWFFPNTQELMDKHTTFISRAGQKHGENKDKPLVRWRPSPVLAGLLCLAFIYVMKRLSEATEFLYFQF